MAYKEGQEPCHWQNPSYVLGTMLANLPTFSQCGQSSQFLQAREVEIINLIFSDEKTDPEKLNDFSGGASHCAMEPGLEFLLDFLIWNAQMLGILKLLVRYCFSISQQTGGKENILSESVPRNIIQECNPKENPYGFLCNENI